MRGSAASAAGSANNIRGLSAEYLVCADLTKQGFISFLAAAGRPYDIVMDIGTKLLRVQVKSTYGLMMDTGQVNATYKFRLGSRQHLRISATHVDLVALVAFDTGTIAYMSSANLPTRVIKLRPAGDKRNPWTKKENLITNFPLSKALKEIA